MAEVLLSVKSLNAWYGESHILHGVDFEVREGEVVTLLGRNGAGKTTTLKCIMGMVARREGSVRYKNIETLKSASIRIACSLWCETCRYVADVTSSRCIAFRL